MKMSKASVVNMLVSGQNDLSWFESNLDKLRDEYNNKFIAFHNKEVLDADTNLDNLMNRLEDKHINTSSVFVKFVSKIKAIL